MNWKILSEYKGIFGGSRRAIVKVQCSCGKIEIRRKDHVLSGRTSSCKSCSAKKTAIKYPPPINSKGFGKLSGTWLGHIKYQAKIRNINFNDNVNLEFLWGLAEKQNFKCALSDIKIIFSNKIVNSNHDYHGMSASLDRIDSSKGYSRDNLQWVHKDINRIKNNLNEKYFIKLCRKIASNTNLNLKT